jgi:hypothetical protein
MLGWLSASLWFLSLTINIVITRPIEIESTKLNSSSVHLTITRHTDSFLLIENTTLVTGRPT